jgi:hypothetical protein
MMDLVQFKIQIPKYRSSLFVFQGNDERRLAEEGEGDESDCEAPFPEAVRKFKHSRSQRKNNALY